MIVIGFIWWIWNVFVVSVEDFEGVGKEVKGIIWIDLD